MKISTFGKLLIISLFLTACSPSVQNAITADQVRSQPATSTVKEYLIQPGDQLDVKFFYNPELNEALLTVRPDGKISLQLAPEITAAGLTPAQLSDLLTKRYATEITKPEVTIIVRTFSSQRVHVDGEVNKAGLVSLVGPTTVLDAIAEAGGFKDSARKEEVIIIRKTADKNIQTVVANLENAIAGVDMNQNIQVLPYDIIFVPRSKIGDVNRFVDLYIRKNIPIPFGVSWGLGN